MKKPKNPKVKESKKKHEKKNVYIVGIKLGVNLLQDKDSLIKGYFKKNEFIEI